MRTLVTAIAAATFLPATAFACGGFFCDNIQPVDQAGERILFLVDDDAGETEVHVQIAYEGPAENFGWILPVPSEPEIKTSVDDVFTVIAAATNPTFVPTPETVGNCGRGRSVNLASPSSAESDDAAQDGSGGSDSTVVIGTQVEVGPYNTTTLTASVADDLVTWLDDNGYDLPDDALDRIKPYIDAGSWFAAIKLAKSRDAGDIMPVALRYAGTAPVIPLQLTGVAATPDMRLQPFVVGKHRAVPDNYLHVHINELAIDWLNAGTNYPAVITAAANEAGGQAFATDYAGSARILDGQLWSAGRYRTAQLGNITDASQITDAMFDAGLPISSGTTTLLDTLVDRPDNIPATDFYQCTGCYQESRSIPVDGAALVELFETDWVPVMRDLQELVDDQPFVTRMTSSLSAEEMTLDPQFVFNPDMGDVEAARQATLQTVCTGGVQFQNAPRRLVLPDGRTLKLPPSSEGPVDWTSYIGEVGEYNAEIVEETHASGMPRLILSNADAIDAALKQTNTGCGCDSRGGNTLGMLGLFGLALLRRRRDG